MAIALSSGESAACFAQTFPKMNDLSGTFAPFARPFRRNMTNHSSYCVKEFMAFSGGSGIILAEAGRERNGGSLAGVGCLVGGVGSAEWLVAERGWWCGLG